MQLYGYLSDRKTLLFVPLRPELASWASGGQVARSFPDSGHTGSTTHGLMSTFSTLTGSSRLEPQEAADHNQGEA